jgi:hypothetical protein
MCQLALLAWLRKKLYHPIRSHVVILVARKAAAADAAASRT